MYNCSVPWYTLVDEISVHEMSVDELSWNLTSSYVYLSCSTYAARVWGWSRGKKEGKESGSG